MSTRMTGGALRSRPAEPLRQTRNSNMSHPVKTVAIFVARAGKAEELRALLDGMIVPSRAEAGNLRYDLWQDQTDPGRFVLDELYADNGAVAAHRASPHFRNYASIIDGVAERTAVTLDPAAVA
jgi:quinol monooxygenase YgiN